MHDSERLKQLLTEAKNDVEKMDDWMKSQEPVPGLSYEEWMRKREEVKDHSNR